MVAAQGTSRILGRSVGGSRPAQEATYVGAALENCVHSFKGAEEWTLLAP